MRYQEENGVLVISLEGRIDSVNAAQVEKELFEIVEAGEDRKVELDASGLEYISSAGLRVLMKLLQTRGEPVTITGVSQEVYEILDVTGFTELFTVKKALRQISIDGLPLVGKGATGSVYRLDPETVIKVFRPEAKMDIIKMENERSTNAFLNGIPTAISYDIVQVGDCYGMVYELLEAEDFLSILKNDKEHLEEHIKSFAQAIKRMHQTEVDPRQFPPTKAGSLFFLDRLSGLCTQEQIGKLRKLYENIPDRKTFIHGDCHPGNVMVRDGEYIFIDLMACGSGHPIFDLGSMCAIYHLPHRPDTPLLECFTDDEIRLIWNTYLGTYLETDDKDKLSRAERQISAVSAARSLFASVFVPGVISPERLQMLKNIALAYVNEGVEPIAF